MVDHLRLGRRLDAVLLHGGPRAQLEHVGLCRPLRRNRRVRRRFGSRVFGCGGRRAPALGAADRRARTPHRDARRVRRAHRRDRRPPVHPRRRALRGVPHPTRSRLLGSDHRVGDRRSRCASRVAHGGRNRLLRAWPGAFHVGWTRPRPRPRVDRPAREPFYRRDRDRRGRACDDFPLPLREAPRDAARGGGLPAQARGEGKRGSADGDCRGCRG